MRITDPEIIKTGEQDLIDSVKNDLDWDAVKGIIKNRMNMESFESKGGEIIIHDGKIAFRIDLELKMAVSLMFDRDGNYIMAEDTPSGIDVSGRVDSSQDLDFSDRGALNQVAQMDDQDTRTAQDLKKNQDTQVEKHDLEFGLPDFPPQADDEESELTDGDFDIGSAVPDTPAPVGDISDELDIDPDSELDLGFDDDLDNMGLDSPSDEKSGIDFHEKLGSDEEDDTFDNDIDDDIDDILEETRELWKQKKE